MPDHHHHHHYHRRSHDSTGEPPASTSSFRADASALAVPSGSLPRRLSSLSPPAASPTRRHLPRTSSLLPAPRYQDEQAEPNSQAATINYPRDREQLKSPSDTASPGTRDQQHPTYAAGSPRRTARTTPRPSSPVRPGSADTAELFNSELRESTDPGAQDRSSFRSDYFKLSVDPEPPFTPLPPLQLLPTLDSSIAEPLAPLIGQVERQVQTQPEGTVQAGQALAEISPERQRNLQTLPGTTMPHDRQESHASSRQSQTSSRQSKRRSSRGSAPDSEKPRSAKPASQKAMLSRALQKANTAVQLDNAQNLEGARQAYAEACDLLQQVLKRTTADEDKKKLEAIRQTYASRIEELDQMGHWQGQDSGSKALPARPGSDDYQLPSPEYLHGSGAGPLLPASQAKWDVSSAGYGGPAPEAQSSPRPRTEQSQLPQPSSSHRRRTSQGTQNGSYQGAQHGILQSSFSRQSSRHPSSAEQGLPQPLNTQRAPTSPRTSLPHRRNDAHQYSNSQSSRGSESRNQHGHMRGVSQSSWLDAIGESGGSGNSSLHSRSSSHGYRRNHIRELSGNTETEFDTALDAAIEAAYDDGYEPMSYDEFGRRESGEEAVAKVMRRVEIARERVRQTERETYGYTNGFETQQRQQEQEQEQEQEQKQEQEQEQDQEQGQQQKPPPQFMLPGHRSNQSSRDAQGGFYDDNSSDEEERMLEEMARDYDIGQFTMDSAPATNGNRQPHQNTKHEDALLIGPAPVEPARALKEKVSLSNISLGPSMPPPKQSLPELPPPRGAQAQQSVRNRRLSGQNPKQLKIETKKLNPPKMPARYLEQPRSATMRETDEERPATATERPHNASHAKSAPSFDIQGVEIAPMSPSRQKGAVESDESKAVSPPAHKIRKNFSSSSLRSMKSRNMSLSNLDEGSDMSPLTPSSNQFGGLRTPAVPAIPTPLSSEFRDNLDSASTGVHLFDDHFHQPTTPGSPDAAAQDAPVPLEPCPSDFLLRPFWLMRCLFQTLVHPRGGYVSTKLFVPRDVWRVKGVKLKNVDDKIANCDLLTAALLKLAHVDTCDADAVLEEMQSLEGVLEQVQTTLARKLGNEVGLQGSAALFKDASGAGDPDGTSTASRSGSTSGKSSFSWRRLRSKSSGVGLGGAYNGKTAASEASRDTNSSMSSLPMTQQPTSRPARRDVAQAQFLGPNANYMGALARLFDAAQAIDEIARQVEDPGLRHADKTQVGLELCTRHAAEFFGFYICRFALNDMSLLMEKFIKRGSEWVLA